MQEGAPSRTAEYVALFRALESQRRPGRRLFHDPDAVRFLGLRLRAAVLAARARGGRRLEDFIVRRWPGRRPSAVVRTKVIDDTLTAALDAGARQVVILGAAPRARAAAAFLAGAVAAGLGAVLLARMAMGGASDPLQIAGSLARPGPG